MGNGMNYFLFNRTAAKILKCEEKEALHGLFRCLLGVIR